MQTSSSNRIKPPILDFGVKFPLCVFPQEENFIPLDDTSYTKVIATSYAKLVEDRWDKFQQL